MVIVIKEIIIRICDVHASPPVPIVTRVVFTRFGLLYKNEDVPKHTNTSREQVNDKRVYPRHPFLFTRRYNRSIPSPETTEELFTIFATYMGIHTRIAMGLNTRGHR